MSRRGLVVLLCAVAGAAALLYVAGRPDSGEEKSPAGAGSEKQNGRSGNSTSGKSGAKPKPQPVLPKSTCPPELSNCVVASGRVIYVEAVDPDGDGDAHFVTISKENVTGAGMTVFDVKPELRPDPLPKAGDTVGGAGPVYTGSHGQKQIEVIEFHVAR